MKKLILLFLPILTFISCNQGTNVKETGETGELKDYVLTELWRTDTIFTTCESVLYHPESDVLFVACINGNPSEKDGKGFISLLETSGELKTLNWVEGLDAPKGMGIYNNKLYVTNIDELVVIDIEKAEIAERIKVENATFLNDVSIDKNGKVYFSDSGTGKIHTYDGKTVSDFITEGLKRPNGLFVEEDRILLTSSESSDLKIIDPESGEMEVVTTEIGAGDGVEFSGIEGYYITSSWSGEVFLIYPDFSKKSLLKTQDEGINSADIGLNPKEQIVYIPTFFDNRVVAYKIESK